MQTICIYHRGHSQEKIQRGFMFWGFPLEMVVFSLFLVFNNSNAVISGFEPVKPPK